MGFANVRIEKLCGAIITHKTAKLKISKSMWPTVA